jgi:hypothetical protein
MSPFQERVVAEKKELDEKHAKLVAFFSTEVFAELPDAEIDRLQRQSDVMAEYSAILGERIAAF